MLSSLRSIVQQVNAAGNIEQIFHIITTELCEVVGTQVCSIYLSNEDDSSLTLVATQGLNPSLVNKFQLRPDQGIVGDVFSKAEYIVTDDAATHESYYPLKDSIEEQTKAFMGVPLIHHRKTLGVLVIQRTTKTRFSEDDVSFMITLSAQLSGIIANAEVKASLELPNRPGELKLIKSLSSIPGIGIAKGWVVTPLDDLEHIPDRHCDNVEDEIARFRDALTTTRAEIRDLSRNLEGTLPKSQLSLFEAFEKMLSYNSIGRKVENLIKTEEIWAPAALSKVVIADLQQFEQLDDPYLKERATDIRDLTQRVLNVLNEAKKQQVSYPRSFILCSEEVTSSMIAEIPPKRLKGIISIKGSNTSHAAIIARTMGIPALMGLRNCPLEQLEDKPLVLDGYQRSLLVSPTRPVLKEYRQRQDNEQAMLDKLVSKGARTRKTKTKDGRRVQMLINTSPNLMDNQHSYDSVDGVGLFRTEYLFLHNDRFPGESEQSELYAQVLDQFSGKPVVLRTMDIGGDKNLPYFPIREENPFLGWRGIRISLDHPEIFATQLRAMLMANLDRGNLHISLPMISTITELERAKELIEQVYDEVKAEGKYSKKRFPFPKIGAVIEVPSAVYQIRRIVEIVDFISIGSNDLTQYMFAADRNNNRVSYLYNSLHPATLLAFAEICDAGQAAGKPVHICGEIAANPLAAMVLVAMGVEGFSMNIRSIPVIRQVIQKMQYKKASEIMAKVLSCHNSYQVLIYLKGLLAKQGLLEFIDPISNQT